MNRHEHLMIRAMEECNELAQRLSKALIFGMDQIQQDADDKPEENPDRLTNQERVLREYEDLAAVMKMIGFDLSDLDHARMNAKQMKVARYLDRSRRCGTLDEGSVHGRP